MPEWERSVTEYGGALYVNIPAAFKEFEKGDKVIIKPHKNGFKAKLKEKDK